MGKGWIGIGLLVLIAVTAGAEEKSPFDTTEEDWDYHVLLDYRWTMEKLDMTSQDILEMKIYKTITEEEGEGPEDLPEEEIAGYTILRPENGLEYYAILEDENERDILIRHADGSIFMGNNYRKEGVFAIREREEKPGVYYKNVLQWPLEIPNLPEDNPLAKYENGIPESMSYPGKGSFYSIVDSNDNTMEDVYYHPNTGEEDFRIKQLPNRDWRLSAALPITDMLGYGNIFECYIRRIEPGVWESDGAFGIQFQLIIHPEEREMELHWLQDEWKGGNLFDVSLRPYYDIFPEWHGK